MKRLWNYGTSTPIQRIGVIVLSIGLISLVSWIIKSDIDIEYIFNEYSFPRSRDSFFFHLYIYLIPLGLLMSWGYEILVKIKSWVLNSNEPKQEINPTSSKKTQNTSHQKPLHFKNNLAAFNFASKNYDAKFVSNNMMVGIVRDILESKTENPLFIVQLADAKEILVAAINDAYAHEVSIGNLVYWGFVEKVQYDIYPEIKAIGHILALLHPEFDPNTGKWAIKKNLTKKI